MYDVIIDKGHVDCESGAVNGQYKECDMTNIIGDKVINILKSTYKLNVGCTTGRLSNRVKFENKNGCKCFVSIHINAGGGTGFENWIYSFGGEAEKLASSIENYYKVLPLKNRGIKSNSFYVLKNTKAPACLVECGFIDTSSDLQYLLNNYDNVANAIAQGIANYVNASVSAPATTERVEKITLPKDVSKIEIYFQ